MRVEAIVLKKIPIREYDELLVCYTADFGKQTYQAKSIQRSHSKQKSHLNTLNHASFGLIETQQTPLVISALCHNGFWQLRQSLPSLLLANFVLECFDKLVFEAQTDPILWQFLLTTLRELDQLPVGYDRRSQYEHIQQQLVIALGYHPDTAVEELTQQSLWSSRSEFCNLSN